MKRKACQADLKDSENLRDGKRRNTLTTASSYTIAHFLALFVSFFTIISKFLGQLVPIHQIVSVLSNAITTTVDNDINNKMMDFAAKCLLGQPNIPEFDLVTTQKNLNTHTTSESKITSNNAINANSNATIKENATNCNNNENLTANENDSKTNEFQLNADIISQHLPRRISPKAEKLMSQYYFDSKDNKKYKQEIAQKFVPSKHGQWAKYLKNIASENEMHDVDNVYDIKNMKFVRHEAKPWFGTARLQLWRSTLEKYKNSNCVLLKVYEFDSIEESDKETQLILRYILREISVGSRFDKNGTQSDNILGILNFIYYYDTNVDGKENEPATWENESDGYTDSNRSDSSNENNFGNKRINNRGSTNGNDIGSDVNGSAKSSNGNSNSDSEYIYGVDHNSNHRYIFSFDSSHSLGSDSINGNSEQVRSLDGSSINVTSGNEDKTSDCMEYKIGPKHKFCIIMQYNPNKIELGKIIDGSFESENYLSTEIILKTMVNIANGVNTLHKDGVIHRDLKPKNIISSVGNQCQNIREPTSAIIDFGDSITALQPAYSFQQMSQFVGTYDFMAPETIIGDALENIQLISQCLASTFEKTMKNIAQVRLKQLETKWKRISNCNGENMCAREDSRIRAQRGDNSLRKDIDNNDSKEEKKKDKEKDKDKDKENKNKYEKSKEKDKNSEIERKIENKCDDCGDMIMNKNMQQEMINTTNNLVNDHQTYHRGSAFTDSYSLCCLYVQLVTGLLPFNVDTDLIDESDNESLLKLTFFEKFYVLLLINLVRKDNPWRDSEQFPFWTCFPKLFNLISDGLCINPTVRPTMNAICNATKDCLRDFQTFQIGYIKVHYFIETQFLVSRDWMDLLVFKPDVLITHCFKTHQSWYKKTEHIYGNGNVDGNCNNMDDQDKKHIGIVDIKSDEDDRHIIAQSDMNGRANCCANDKPDSDGADSNLDRIIQHNVALNTIQFTNCNHLKQYLQQCLQDPTCMEPGMLFMHQVPKFVAREEKSRKHRWQATRRAKRRKQKKKSKNNCNDNNNNNSNSSNDNSNDFSFNDKSDRIWKYYPTKYFNFKPNSAYHMLETELRMDRIDCEDAAARYPFHVEIALNYVCTHVIYLYV